ncbi:MAG: SpvB/TcaC N-terminal domain-containing protein, partial [Chitinophagaceae bacterium]
MIRNFLFLSYFTCVLFAVVYSVKQKPVTTLTASSYSIKNEEKDSRQAWKQVSKDIENSEEIIYTENNTGDVPVPDGSPIDDHYDNIISAPITQLTEGYSPNTLKEIPMADPSDNISLISAPSANSSGNASLVFNMKLPGGRMGLQPNLSIQYNNEGGNSWLGTGWNMSLPSISVETRWGSPRYEAALESEIYSFNGEELAPLTNRSEFVTRSADKRFYQRAESNFNKIIRHGTGPANYWWEVTEKNGTHNFYGGRPGTNVVDAAVLKDDANNIGYWGLVETRDANNNFVRYVYETVSDPGIENGIVPGKQLYLSQVLYTGSGTTDGPYKIEFTRDRQMNETK